MRTIYKYELELTDEQSIADLGESAKILSAQFRNGTLCVWVSLYTDNGWEPKFARKIIICGTGNPLPDIELRHIDTVQDPRGLVWHVFEVL